MLSLSLTFQGTVLPAWEKFNSNVAAKCESVSKCRHLLIINLVKRENKRKTNACNSLISILLD